MPEQGIVVPGDLVVGADSHTCTYGALGAFSTGVGSTDLAAAIITGELWFKVPETIKLVYTGKLKPWVGGKDLILYTIGKIGVDGALYQAMEFTGETIDALTMDDRLTMANMAVEAGAKNGIFHPDQTTENYVKGRAKRKYRFYSSDAAAPYRETFEFDVSKIEPQVAFPHLPSNTKAINEIGHHPIDQAVIGSCTNGRLSDMRMAAEVLKGHKIDSAVRLIIIPATPTIYRLALKEGLFDVFLDAGAVISPPTCGPCLGGYMGVLAKGEKAIATTNRNFVGRMGHRESEVYLSNPAVAAASAVLGASLEALRTQRLDFFSFAAERTAIENHSAAELHKEENSRALPFLYANHQCPEGLRILAFRPLNEKLKIKKLCGLCASAVRKIYR